MHLNVATYNLYGRVGDFRSRYDGIVSALRSMSPDVVGLVEIWRDDDEEQLEHLAHDLGYAYRASADVSTHQGRPWGVGVLSRLPILDDGRLEFPNPSLETFLDQRPGVALITTLKSEAGPLDFVCLCEWGLSWSGYGASCTEDRTPSYVALARELYERNRNIAPIVVGDFNSVPDNRDMRAVTGKEPQLGLPMTFLDAWELANGGHGGWTLDGIENQLLRDRPFGRHRIDYILAGAGHDFECLWRVNGARVFGQAEGSAPPPSDHYGVQADLELVRLFPADLFSDATGAVEEN
jgi:endonuclease/exonuclease/phosphatase family metal-dependent hydrolase